MRKKELWEALKCDLEIPQVYGCDQITEDENGLILKFICKDEKKVIIAFEGVVYSFRRSIESVFITTFSYLRNNYDESFYKAHWIFKVKNSNYLEWIQKESGDLYTQESIQHFVFYTPEEVIEVLSPFPPQILVNTCANECLQEID